MSVLDWLLGRPLASDDEGDERLGVAAGIPTFGLDALSSAAYGPEAALTLLIPLGAAGATLILPLSLVIILLLAIVFFSYRQTIAAYPNGGGSYTVASENLGPRLGVLAAAALMVDYLLDVAVGISAGVGALVSAAPRLQPHTVALCLGILLLLTFLNLRGVREAGVAFIAPTFLFLLCLLAVIAIGLARTWAAGGHPTPVSAPPAPFTQAVGAFSLWLLIRAFAAGCTALTGIEAVSNGVRAFRDPAVATARRTLAIIVALLAVLLAGIAYLIRAYGIVARPPGQPGYQSVLSMLTTAVAGRGWFYDLTIAAILCVLALSANTAFADFPRLCRLVAEADFLPSFFAIRGRRLVYSVGILVLALFAAVLLIVFQGVTDRLIPLFAIGAFLAFTLSQAGMVSHWRRHPGRGSRVSLCVNGVGALATGVTVAVVLVAKFTQGAWITVLIIPSLWLLMRSVHRQYQRIRAQLALPRSEPPLPWPHLQPPLVIVPMAHWNRATAAALRFACSISRDIVLLHVRVESDAASDQDWPAEMSEAARLAGAPTVRCVILPSPYRFLLRPVMEYVIRLEREHPGRQLAVVLPQVTEKRWYHSLLHNHYALALDAMLRVRTDHRVAVINISWQLAPP